MVEDLAGFVALQSKKNSPQSTLWAEGRLKLEP
jgi:hypothetical protein